MKLEIVEAVRTVLREMLEFSEHGGYIERCEECAKIREAIARVVLASAVAALPEKYNYDAPSNMGNDEASAWAKGYAAALCDFAALTGEDTR